MKSWLFWAGVGFIVGGAVSYLMNLGATEAVMAYEDISGFAIGWMAAGAVLLGIGIIKK